MLAGVHTEVTLSCGRCVCVRLPCGGTQGLLSCKRRVCIRYFAGVHRDSVVQKTRVCKELCGGTSLGDTSQHVATTDPSPPLLALGGCGRADKGTR